MNDNVYLNGEYLPAQQAYIPILDRGFMFGDGVYEVIPVYKGQVFREHEHLARLQASLEAILVNNPLTDQQWSEVFRQLMYLNTGSEDASIYLQVTRGVMQVRDHAFDASMQPTVLVMCRPVEFPTQDKNTAGYKAITLDDNRWMDCYIKSVNLLPNVLLKQQAINQGAVEAILIRDGNAIEGSASNLFVVKDDIVQTPAKGRFMLGGITRNFIIELCNTNKIIVQEKVITEDELHDADEIWMTSSTKEIIPITTLNQHKVGKGAPGAKWMQLIDLYQGFKQNVTQA